MTNLVSTAAYAQMCRGCRRHAIVVTTSGEESAQFASKETGFEAVDFGKSLGLITKEEALALHEIIKGLELPEMSCRHTLDLEAKLNRTCAYQDETDMTDSPNSFSGYEEEEVDDDDPGEPPPTVH